MLSSFQQRGQLLALAWPVMVLALGVSQGGLGSRFWPLGGFPSSNLLGLGASYEVWAWVLPQGGCPFTNLEVPALRLAAGQLPVTGQNGGHRPFMFVCTARQPGS